MKKKMTFLDAEDLLISIMTRLRKYAVAFDLVGNETVGIELRCTANEIAQSLEILRESFEELNREALQAARANVGNLLSATLAGAIKSPADHEQSR